MQCLDYLKVIADTYVQLANVYDGKKNELYGETLKKALDYYEVTANMIQNARKEISSDESKMQLVELEQATFQKMIKAAFNAYEVNADPKIVDFAFKNAERIKASSVYDRLSDELAKNNSLIPDSLEELGRTLNYSITQNNEKLYYLNRQNNPNLAEIERTDSLLFELKKQRDELNHYLEENYSSFYNLKYTTLMFGISDIQKKLKSNEALLEYVFIENDSIPELYTLFVTPGNIRFENSEIDTTFVTAVKETFSFMSSPRYMFTRNRDALQFCKSSNYLYRKLIQPFEKEITDKKLLIIPDGKLSYISFDALLSEMPDTTAPVNFARLKYLIKENSINYSYSANLLYKFEGRSDNSGSKKVLAFAPEYAADSFVFNNKQLALVPLPGIQKEVDLISNEITTSSFRGNDATEDNFLKWFKDFDILHFAMHAFIDDSNPAFSRLAFARNKNNGTENRWLYTADIYNLDLSKAKLTVLSACNTGSGQLRKGEGVMSLARGFLYAGCPSIVMTLWEVEDNAGTQIMASFYKNLKKGRSIDEALRLAKLEYLENANPRTAHPHYWLGYVSIGNSSPLFRSYDYYFFGLLILALIVIIVDQLIRIRKIRKKRS